MALTFKDLQALDVSAVFLNTDEFAETVSYQPVAGAARSIVADCEEELNTVDGPNGIYHQGVLRVMVKRDETLGIDDPRIGDGITRTIDGNAVTFSYSGQFFECDEYAWTLVFIRNIPYERR